MTKDTKKSKDALSPKLIEEILQHADGQELFGVQGFFQQLKGGLVNGMLEGDMEHHLGYQKHNKSNKSADNSRNGHYPKTVISGDDTLDIAVPRDREGAFEPRIVPKGVHQFDDFEKLQKWKRQTV